MTAGVVSQIDDGSSAGGLSSAAVSTSISTALSTAESSVVSLSTAVGSGGGGIKRLVLLGKLLGADFNNTGDQSITLTQPGTGSWAFAAMVVNNASTSLTTAKGALYAGAGKSNIMLGVATTPYTGCVASTDQIQIMPTNATDQVAPYHFALFGSGTASATVFLSLTTPQGSAATADVYIFGYDLS